MVLPASVSMLVLGPILLFGVGGFAIIVFLRRRHRAFMVLGASLMAIGGFAYACVGFGTTERIVVSEKGDRLLAKHNVEYGWPRFDGRGTRTVIDNRSSRSLELWRVEYAKAGTTTDAPTHRTIDPDETFELVGNVDYIGPEDKPPTEISGIASSEYRLWLTW